MYIATNVVIPEILEPVENTSITVDQFTPVEFDCSAAGIPPPIISWVRVFENGSTMELMASRIMLTEPVQGNDYELEGRGVVPQVNRTLMLKRPVDNDSGTYRCIATNIASDGMQDFELVVQGMYMRDC